MTTSDVVDQGNPAGPRLWRRVWFRPLLFAGPLALGFTVAVIVGRPFLGDELPERGPFYSGLASVMGSLLGFTVTAASIVAGFSGTGHLAKLFPTAAYGELLQLYKLAIAFEALATVAALAGLAVDLRGPPCFLLWHCLIWLANGAVFLMGASVYELFNAIELARKKVPPP